MGLEVQEVRPIETPRQTGTVDFPATMVPPTVVALLPKGAETVVWSQIDPGYYLPMQIVPCMHVKSPEAIMKRRRRLTASCVACCNHRAGSGRLSAAPPAPAQPPRGSGGATPAAGQRGARPGDPRRCAGQHRLTGLVLPGPHWPAFRATRRPEGPRARHEPPPLPRRPHGALVRDAP